MEPAIAGYILGALMTIVLSSAGGFAPNSVIGRVLAVALWPAWLALMMVVGIIGWFWDGP